jgi:hypothetical protein
VFAATSMRARLLSKGRQSKSTRSTIRSRPGRSKFTVSPRRISPGACKCELVRGEHKSLQTDRIVLVPGPNEEIETVRWIYRTFVEQQTSETEIASLLNERGIVTDLRRFVQ